MKQSSGFLSIYAADTSGVCSALYELGGMTVVHDASGCNSTYSTHDEPRWYSMDSMIFISALTETDAVTGNDEKLVSDVVSAARDLSPRFIALCGSPLPAMVGTDFDAIAEEIAARVSVPVFGLHTNGIRSYLSGASEAFLKVGGHFLRSGEKRSDDFSANILGATPLDFSVNGSVDSIRRFLHENSIRTVACLAMGSTLDDWMRAGSAHVNLVVSWDGLALAELLFREYGIPYVTGVPFGKKFSARLADSLRTAARTARCLFPCAERTAPEKGGLSIVGESIFATSLACAEAEDSGTAARVLCPLETEDRLLVPGDVRFVCEDDAAALFPRADGVLADPMYAPVCPENVPFYRLPHEAFSGRCFRKEIPDLIGRTPERRTKSC